MYYIFKNNLILICFIRNEILLYWILNTNLIYSKNNQFNIRKYRKLYNVVHDLKLFGKLEYKILEHLIKSIIS